MTTGSLFWGTDALYWGVDELTWGPGDAQTADLPLIDGSDIFAPTFSYLQTLDLPLIDGGWVFAPTVLGTVTAGLVVTVGATTLDESFARSWRDEYAGPGSWSLSMANADADMPEFDDLVTFTEDGHIRFSGPVQAKRATTFSPGEGVDEVTVLSGLGRLARTDRAPIAPSRGWDAEPVEVTRSQAWMSVDFDSSGWARAKRIRRVDIGTPYFPYRSIPEWYPDKTAWEVAPNRADITSIDAPLGRSLYRSDDITLDAGTIEVVFGLNNKGQCFFDGALIGDIDNSPTDANRVRFDVSAGDHQIAASVVNFIRDTWFVASIYSVDSDGLLDDLLWSSDSDNMRALPYPSTIPGFTPGEAVRLLVEELQADGFLTDLVLDFTDTLDSDGQAWTQVVEITTEVGRYLMEYLESLAGWAVDVQMAPGADRLRMWNWGTRGGTPGVTIAATSNPNTSEVEGLSFDGRQVRANQARIRYKRGYTFVDLAGSDDPVCVFLDYSNIDSESTAQDMATNELELRTDPSWAGTLSLLPVTSTPYDDFDNGDYVTHPANPDGGTSSRVRAITRGEDENGIPSWGLELHDIRQEIQERQDNWLKRTAMGNLAGGSRVTSRSGDSIPAASKVSSKTVAEFSFQDPTDGAITGKRPAESSGNLVEVFVEVSTEDDVATTTASTVRVFHNGVSLGTVTVPAGDTSAELDLSAAKVYRNVDKFRAEVITVGGGVNGVDVQVRAI